MNGGKHPDDHRRAGAVCRCITPGRRSRVRKKAANGHAIGFWQGRWDENDAGDCHLKLISSHREEPRKPRLHHGISI